jgi:hypothetical protein
MIQLLASFWLAVGQLLTSYLQLLARYWLAVGQLLAVPSACLWLLSPLHWEGCQSCEGSILSACRPEHLGLTTTKTCSGYMDSHCAAPHTIGALHHALNPAIRHVKSTCTIHHWSWLPLPQPHMQPMQQGDRLYDIMET